MLLVGVSGSWHRLCVRVRGRVRVRARACVCVLSDKIVDRVMSAGAIVKPAKGSDSVAGGGVPASSTLG